MNIPRSTESSPPRGNLRRPFPLTGNAVVEQNVEGIHRSALFGRDVRRCILGPWTSTE
ncbi:MAG: hypothetical protein ABI273_04885 [Lacunisphaera sp.]